MSHLTTKAIGKELNSVLTSLGYLAELAHDAFNSRRNEVIQFVVSLLEKTVSTLLTHVNWHLTLFSTLRRRVKLKKEFQRWDYNYKYIHWYWYSHLHWKYWFAIWWHMNFSLVMLLKRKLRSYCCCCSKCWRHRVNWLRLRALRMHFIALHNIK